MFLISHGESTEVDNYLATKKHKISVKVAASSSCVTSFFKNIGSDVALATTAKEAAFAYRTATDE